MRLILRLKTTCLFVQVIKEGKHEVRVYIYDHYTYVTWY